MACRGMPDPVLALSVMHPNPVCFIVHFAFQKCSSSTHYFNNINYSLAPK